MTNWNSYTTTSLEVDGIEVELETEPHEGTDVEYKREGNKLVVAYLTHDSDCGNPLADQDGNGMIHWHPRSEYGRTCGDEYLSLLNIDQYGGKIIDEDKLQKTWHDKVMALPLELFEHERWSNSPEWHRKTLAEENIISDYTVFQQALGAWGYGPTTLQELGVVPRIEEALNWDYEAEADKCWKGPEKGVVLLDCYEHGDVNLCISGSGMQCRWDTSSGAAVWAADESALLEIDRRAAVYAFGWVDSDNAYPSSRKRFTVFTDLTEAGKCEILGGLGGFKTWSEAYEALEDFRTGIEPTPEQLARGIERATEEICKSALEEYNAWSNGDCWNVWSQRFELIDEKWVEVGEFDVCGGYVGTEWAEQEMQERLHFNNWPEK